MHSSFLKIGIAAVLVLLFVCCGAAAAKDVAEVNVTEIGGSITTTYYTEFADAWNNATSPENRTNPVTVKLLDNVTTLITLRVLGSSSLTLDLNGHVLNKSGTQNSVIIVDNSGNLTLKDSNPTAKHMFRSGEDGLWILDEDPDNKIISGGVITGGNNSGTGGGVIVQKNCIFTMYSGNIIGNKAGTTGGGVQLSQGCTFNMYGGNITGNSAGSNGGGVYVTGNNAKFEMTGGNITGNKAETQGGGVSVSGSCTFTMSGGNITDNNAGSNGGGVYITMKGEFKMYGNAKITGNEATNSGGGVYVYVGTFEMSNGDIKGNTATDGGGVYVTSNDNYNKGIFNMSGGSIAENTATTNGGGVYVIESGEFNVSGTPKISGNTNSTPAANNVYLNGANKITITSALTSEANIGIINPLEKDAQFGQNSSSYTIKDTDATCFYQDIGTLIAKRDGSTLKWVEKTVAKIGNAEYPTVQAAVDAATDDGDTIVMIDNSTEETISVGKKVTLNLNGFVLNHTGDGSVITIGNGGNLTLTDSNTGNKYHYFVVQTDGLWKLDDSKTDGTLLESINNASELILGTTVIKVTGGVITGGNANTGDKTNNCGGVLVNNGGIFTMNGGNIIGNKATNGADAGSGGVYVYANSGTSSTFTMNRGNIAGNTKADNAGGGGVMISRSTASETSSFTMNGGNIIGNTATKRGGGGVDAWSGEFNMTGGNITGNKNTCDSTDNTKGSGGGVYVNAGACKFKMSNTANIAGNTAKNGGGVFVTSHGHEVTMSGGSIKGNTATNNGGGVHISGYSGNGYEPGTFTMSGGSITENTATQNGGGVYNGGTFNVSGTPKISGNKKDTEANNVYLPTGKTITIASALQPGAKIWVNPTDGAGPGTPTPFTSGWSVPPQTLLPSSIFIADSGNYVAVRSSNEVVFMDTNYAVCDSGSVEPSSYNSTLNDAYAAALDGQTIIVLRDVTEAAQTEMTGDKSVTLNLNGKSITAGDAFTNGLIKWDSTGKLTLTDTTESKNGKLNGNSTTRVLYINKGTVEMNAGTITGGSATHGGGVYNEGTFNMTGGSIIGNSVTGIGTYGGGVHISGGTFNMTGGNITGNSAETGGGGVHNEGTFEMSGGNITENSVSGDGGGVWSGGTFKVKDAPFIKNNTKTSENSANNVHLNSAAAAITLVDALQSNAYIGIINPLRKNVPIGRGDGIYQISDEDAACFHSDKYELTAKRDGNELNWGSETPTPAPSSPSSSSRSYGASTILPAAPADTQGAQITHTITAQYAGHTFVSVSAGDASDLGSVSPEIAAAAEIKISTAKAAGIKVTNGKGAPALIMTTAAAAGLDTVTFSEVYDIKPSNPNEKLTQVTVTVPKADVVASGLTTDDVTIYHFLEAYDLWVPLDTLQITEDEANYYYTAATDGASPFGVLIKRFAEAPASPQPTSASPAPVAGIIAGLGAAGLVFGLRRK